VAFHPRTRRPAYPPAARSCAAVDMQSSDCGLLKSSRGPLTKRAGFTNYAKQQQAAAQAPSSSQFKHVPGMRTPGGVRCRHSGPGHQQAGC